MNVIFFLLALVFFSCGADEVATPAQLEAMCEARCSWMAGCEYDDGLPLGCSVSECTNEEGPSHFEASAAFVKAMTACYRKSTCEIAQTFDRKIPDFYCVKEVSEQIITGEAKLQQQRCLAKLQQCRDDGELTFNDDWCNETPIYVVSSVRDAIRRCWEKPCAEIDLCFEQLHPE